MNTKSPIYVLELVNEKDQFKNLLIQNNGIFAKSDFFKSLNSRILYKTLTILSKQFY